MEVEKSNKQIVNSMSNSESIYSKISKMMLGIEIVETIYDRQKNESSVPEQICRPLVIFTFLSTNIGLLVKKSHGQISK